MKGSRFEQQRRIQRVEATLRTTLLNMPSEARGRTFYCVEGEQTANIDLPMLLEIVLFGEKEDRDLVRAAQILRNLVDDTPDALDGLLTEGSLSFLVAATVGAKPGLIAEVGGVWSYDVARTWRIREAIYEAADLQINSKADQVR